MATLPLPVSSWRPACCLLLALFCAAAPGCTRRFFRKAADKEVDATLAEKDHNEAWQIENYHVYPDPRSRFADPTNPDRPPMPPDDPDVRAHAPNPQKPGKAGIDYIEGVGYLDLLKEWDAENRSHESEKKDTTADAATPENAPKPYGDAAKSTNTTADTEKKGFLLKLEQAIELGLINSREYQDRREDLYLTALPVTLQRFSFAAQFLATEQAVRERTGRETVSGQHNRFRFNSNTGFNKLFSTGALLLFRFANQTVVELTGNFPKHTTSVSTVSLDLTQPFLRGGGRAVTLEPLTQAERNLVYGIRDYARFRKEYYVALAGGGEFGAVGRFFSFGVPTSGNAPTEGFLPVLLRSVLIRNERQNVEALADFLRRYQALQEGGDFTQLQVDQVELQMLQGRSTVLQREQEYRDALDRLKQQLGVPTDLPLQLDESPLRPLVKQLDDFRAISDQFEAARTDVNKLYVVDRTDMVRPGFRRLFTDGSLVANTRFRAELPPRWAEWEKLTDDQLAARLKQQSQERDKLLDRKADLDVTGAPFPEADALRLQELRNALDLGLMEQILRTYEARPWQKRPAVEQQRLQAVIFRDLLTSFDAVLGIARRERLEQVRKQWPKLPRLCVGGVNLLDADLDTSLAIVAREALVNRLDLNNARAQLVDSWRRIAVNANALFGVFDVQYFMDATTPAGQAKPIAFNGSRMRNQLIINGELPLIRKLERNNYRATLVGYQRARRSLMEREDVIVQQVRTEMRALRVLAENFAIQQRAVELAYLQVDQALDTINQPPTPTAGTSPGAGGGAGNAAALTQQLLNAQRGLPNALNQLYTIWINYQVTRMSLYRDLELLPLDPRGVWIDESVNCQCGPGSDGPSEPGPRHDERPAAAEGGAAPDAPAAGAGLEPNR